MIFWSYSTRSMQASVRANVSVKLTQIGLALDESLCEQNLKRILTQASPISEFCPDRYGRLPPTPIKPSTSTRLLRNKGYENTGLVVQSYLYRTEKDTRGLIAEGTRFRLVKGAYKEPKELAFPKKEDVDTNFDLLTQIIIDGALGGGISYLERRWTYSSSPRNRLP